MGTSRRDFLKEVLAGTMIVGVASLPQPIAAMTANPSTKKMNKPGKAKRVTTDNF